MKSISKLDKGYANMGDMNEKLYKPIINKIYGTVFKTSYKYSRIDFIGENYCGELKSRNLNYDTFNETMIGYNKITEGFNKLDFYRQGNSNYKMYFWFAFKEGLYVWELTKENYELNGGDKQKRMGGTSNRGYNDYKEHYYIKTELLTKIDDTPVWIDPDVEVNSYKIPHHKTEGVCLLKIKK
jgi:hypothetical protein